MMALSAPVPMPAITRAAKNGGQLSTQALTSEATQYSASAHIITARRPIRSPSVPASSAPKKNPMKVLLPSSPICTLVRPHSTRSTGRMNASTAASMASNI